MTFLTMTDKLYEEYRKGRTYPTPRAEFDLPDGHPRASRLYLRETKRGTTLTETAPWLNADLLA